MRKTDTGEYLAVIHTQGMNGEATITLEENDGQTTIGVDSDAQVGGPVARVGQRLMDSVAKMIMDNFFKCLRESIE